MPLISLHPLLFCVQDWGGVHTNVLKQALNKLDRKRQVHRCLSLNMKTIDCVISDLVQVQPVLCCYYMSVLVGSCGGSKVCVQCACFSEWIVSAQNGHNCHMVNAHLLASSYRD